MVTASSDPSFRSDAPSVRLALLDEGTAARLQNNIEQARDLEVVWVGTDLAKLRELAPKLR